ncbi:MAG: gliding motility-associated ABC transporter substrate-binding protein GldG [Flavobacteriales bacterium]|nr:gliding motility-associated ABC transporter substrate-binding protein GldG [Flavobacteriales bacterium]
MAKKENTKVPGKRSNRAANLLELIAGIGIVLVLLVIGSYLRVRVDLTSEKRHTLTDATKELVRDLEDIVYVKVYLSGDLPADLQRLAQATRDLLDEMRVYQAEHIQYTFIDPSASADEKTRNDVYQQLQDQGLSYSSLTFGGKGAHTELIIFPGALITYREKTVPVQLLRSQYGASDPEIINRSVNNLEYEFSSAIRQAISTRKSKVAFLEGHGELPPMLVMDATTVLGEQYEVSRVRIDGRIDALSKRVDGMKYRANEYDALIIAKPDSTFSQQDRYVVDQFVMNGGKVLWLLDAMNPYLDSLRVKQFSMALPRDLGLDNQLAAYGVRVNKDLVLDMSCAPIEIMTEPYGGQRKRELLPWYFEPILVPQSNHPIVANIDPVHTRFVSSLDTLGSDEIRKTVLLTTSPYSRSMRNPVRISLNITKMEMGFERNSTPYMPVAVLLEGPFTSAFIDRLPADFTNDPEVGYREQGTKTAQLVISDGDVIENRIDPAKGVYFPLGWDRYSNAKRYGNREFIINAMNYLLDDQGLISIRSRAISLRLLDSKRIEDERRYWQVVNTVVPILLSLLAGLLFHLLRVRANRAPATGKA